MADREKIIKGLEYHLKELSVGKTCFECPYYGDNPCEIQLIANAISMLKEQEALAVHDPGAYCPKCGWMLYHEDHPHYCGNCGQAVKWE